MRNLAFDVGANVGTKTRELLDLGFGHVVAIEPLFDSPFDPSDTRVTWIKSLVSDSSEPRSIYPLGTISTVETSFMEGRFKGAVWGAPVTVPSTTLAWLIGRFGVPDYVKIDVEHHELAVIRGMPFTRPVPMLSFEWHSEFRESAFDCVFTLQSMGYSRFHLQFEDSIANLHSVNCSRDAAGVMADFDEMCLRKSLPWGQVYAQW